MKIGIVTTFSDKGYQEYGHWFVESAKRFIDNELAGAAALGLGKISDHELNLLENQERDDSSKFSSATENEAHESLDSDDDWDSDDSDDERS